MAKRISRTKKLLVIAAVGALTLGGAGAAFAYWTSTGTGTGAATTGEAVEFVITTSTATGVLAPGSAGQTVPFTVSNPGPGQLYLQAVTVRLADDTGTQWVPPTGCLFSDYTVTINVQPTPGTMDVGVLNARSGTALVTLALSEENQDGCKGADVPLYFEALSVID